jgi:hypothetical protein
MGADPLSAADFRRNACAPVLRVKDLGWLIVFLPSGVRVLDPEGWARLLVEPGNPRFDDVVREAADLGKPRPGRA